MSPQESQVLQNFLHQLSQATGVAKDPQADALITHAVSQQPDAAYLLVQRALLLDQALSAAQAQIAALQTQVRSQQPDRSTGFLDAGNAWGNSASGAPRQTTAPATVTVQPGATAAPAIAAPGFLNSGAGGVLGTIAATAAGVAGGAFLFQGIGNLLGHHGGAGFGGQQHGMAAVPAEHPAPEEHVGNDNFSSSSSNLATEAGIDDVIGNDDVSSI